MNISSTTNNNLEKGDHLIDIPTKKQPKIYKLQQCHDNICFNDKDGKCVFGCICFIIMVVILLAILHIL